MFKKRNIRSIENIYSAVRGVCVCVWGGGGGGEARKTVRTAPSSNTVEFIDGSTNLVCFQNLKRRKDIMVF